MNLSICLWNAYWNIIDDNSSNEMIAPQGQKTLYVSKETAFSPFDTKIKSKERRSAKQAEQFDESTFYHTDGSLQFMASSHPIRAPIMVITDESPFANEDIRWAESFRSLVSWAESIKSISGHPQPKLGLFYEVNSNLTLKMAGNGRGEKNDSKVHCQTDANVSISEKGTDKGTQMPERKKGKKKKSMPTKSLEKDTSILQNAEFQRAVLKKSQTNMKITSDLISEKVCNLYFENSTLFKPIPNDAGPSELNSSSSAFALPKSPSLSRLMLLFTSLIIKEKDNIINALNDEQVLINDLPSSVNEKANISFALKASHPNHFEVKHNESNFSLDKYFKSENNLFSKSKMLEGSVKSSNNFDLYGKSCPNHFKLLKNSEINDSALNLSKHLEKSNVLTNHVSNKQLKRNSLCSSSLMNVFLDIMDNVTQDWHNGDNAITDNFQKSGTSFNYLIGKNLKHNLRKIMSDSTPNKGSPTRKLPTLHHSNMNLEKQEKLLQFQAIIQENQLVPTAVNDIHVHNSNVHKNGTNSSDLIDIKDNVSKHSICHNDLLFKNCKPEGFSNRIMHPKKKCSHDTYKDEFEAKEHSQENSNGSNNKYTMVKEINLRKTSHHNPLTRLRECLPSCCSFTELNSSVIAYSSNNAESLIPNNVFSPAEKMNANLLTDNCDKIDLGRKCSCSEWFAYKLMSS